MAVYAPTGLAAFNENNITVHKLLQLSIEHGSIPAYIPLNDEASKCIILELKYVASIDEISMVSSLTLMYINLRLTEINNTCDTGITHGGLFGNKHILLYGDLLLLQPVTRDPLFVDISDKMRNKYLLSLSSDK